MGNSGFIWAHELKLIDIDGRWIATCQCGSEFWSSSKQLAKWKHRRHQKLLKRLDLGGGHASQEFG